jgi:hypothetical protein
MGHEDDLRTQQGGGPYIFNDIVVVADQDAAFASVQIKHHILLPGGKVLGDEGMQLPEFGHKSVSGHTYIGVVKLSFLLFHQSCQERHIVLARQADQLPGAFARRNLLGQVKDFLLRKFSSESCRK